ncbi:UDP-glycosyltransferase UGT5-like [Anopheles darlingi]|uniref:UDP-glycosyltransferase UGT5-like n=1 Tax=Anopheles darlingi TaxID=43151 RepID=UPI0020FFFB7A|nr:UDP-glycosyltransferase UGT5-like [Anopheles darlingi]XP_049530269.1 UDP-glycosyltransferase UGT5-like [Anopheles darlingi]
MDCGRRRKTGTNRNPTMLRLAALLAGALLVAMVPVGTVQGENILFLQTICSKSHHIWNRQIFDRLYENGHNLTILSFEQEASVPGKTFLVMAEFQQKLMAKFADTATATDFSSYEGAFGNIMNVYQYYEVSSALLVEEPAIKRLLDYPRSFRFDLIVHDFTMGQFLLGFVQRFGNPPLVAVSAYNIPSYTQFLADIPIYTTYLPHPASSFGSRMSFTERARNTVYWWFDMLYRQQIFMPRENQRMQLLFEGDSLTHVKLLERRTELVLVNSDPALDFYQLLPPNVVQVGGLHIKRPEEMTPMMKQFMARANRGVILFSFGTNVQSEMLGPEINRQLLELFRSMPEYGFIWKHANADGLIMPPNVLMTPWVPQSAVLANSRTKLLVSHGGLLSLHEAAWNGVPVIGVPFFADQFSNVRRLELSGTGVGIPSTKLNGETLREALEKLLNDPSYRKRAKELSNLFRAQPEPPLDRAIFWIEKVIANKGLRYLRSPARSMAPYQVYGLDMLAVLLLIALGYYLIFKRHSKPATAGSQRGPAMKRKEE